MKLVRHVATWRIFLRLICANRPLDSIMDIEKVYDRYSVRLYNMSLRIVGDGFEAEEIMHDTLLQYYRLKDQVKVQDLEKWLSTVCIRKSVDSLRQRKRFLACLEEYEDPSLSDVREDNHDFDVARIRDALQSLPDIYRVVLTLHLFEGYDYQEISQITEVKEVTIRSIYMRGRKKLADLLKTR